MTYQTLTFPQFQQRYPSEEACIEAIYASRWPHGFICPYCGHNDGYRLSRRRTVQCCSCRRQTSITAGTVFHRTKIPLKQWFLMIYLLAQDKGGASALRIAKQLGMHYATTWFILQKIRTAMSRRDENLTLAGFIEIDEAFFGGRARSKRARKPPSTNKKLVLVMVESEGVQAGSLVMKVIKKPTWDAMKPVIASKVDADPPGQWFRSDGWGAHHVVMALGHKLKCAVVAPTDLDRVLVNVHLAIAHAKRFLMGTHHQYCKRHLQRYLDEFCYRWNRRHQWCQLASRLLKACALCDPIKYAALT